MKHFFRWTQFERRPWDGWCLKVQKTNALIRRLHFSSVSVCAIALELFFRLLNWYRRQDLAWNAPVACKANAHGEYVGIPSGLLWLSFHHLTEFKKRDFTGHIANWEILSPLISCFSPWLDSAWCIVLFLCRNQRSRKDYNPNVRVMLWSSGSGTRF